jgi:hypothetical protein
MSKTRKISKGCDTFGLEVYPRFGGTYCLQLTGKYKRSKKQTKRVSYGKAWFTYRPETEIQRIDRWKGQH